MLCTVAHPLPRRLFSIIIIIVPIFFNDSLAIALLITIDFQAVTFLSRPLSRLSHGKKLEQAQA